MAGPGRELIKASDCRVVAALAIHEPTGKVIVDWCTDTDELTRRVVLAELKRAYEVKWKPKLEAPKSGEEQQANSEGAQP